MTLYIVALLLTFCVQGPDQDDCSFSAEGQLEVLKNVGTRYPGGKTNVKEREITWFSENGDKTVFAYGGCEDLGPVISVTSKMKTPRSQQAVLSTASGLGERFWPQKLEVNKRRLCTPSVEGKQFNIIVSPLKTSTAKRSLILAINNLPSSTLSTHIRTASIPSK